MAVNYRYVTVFFVVSVLKLRWWRHIQITFPAIFLQKLTVFTFLSPPTRWLIDRKHRWKDSMPSVISNRDIFSDYGSWVSSDLSRVSRLFKWCSEGLQVKNTAHCGVKVEGTEQLLFSLLPELSPNVYLCKYTVLSISFTPRTHGTCITNLSTHFPPRFV